MFPSFDLQQFLHQFLYDPKNPLLFNNGFFVYLFFIFMMLYFYWRNKISLRTNLFCFVSLYFFYKASGFFVVFVIISAIADFILSNAIYRQKKHQLRKILLTISILFNLGLLFYFKYTDFFIQILNNNLGAHINPLNILLPVGISFYTFENISYVVDVYRGEFVPVKKFNRYLLFLSFFPKLVMGPIVRAKDFIPQIDKPYRINKDDFSEGFFLIITGLFRKLVISDYITVNFVNYIFDAPGKYSGLECLFAVYGYAVIIYCDFSGYSSIAIGIARWLGFTIPANFISPYQSTSITEFWRRWHISLSSWLRDYLYIPLGGNRLGKIRTYVNLFITMLLGGLWHGASFNFIVWGGLHGVALSVHKLWGEATGKIAANFTRSRLYRIFTLLLTFHFVCFCWIFFKAKNFTVAGDMINQIGHHLNWGVWQQFWANYHNVLLMIFLGLFLHFLPESLSVKIAIRFRKFSMAQFVVVFLIFAVVYGIFKSAEPVMPVYLQF
jgi:D-alanyl-lipoteichoic acid acyltransferase DltB (MBOAT superfamily)